MGSTAVLGFVDQHQDVRQLELGVAPHLDARRQARDNRAFGRANRAGGAGAEVVVLEVELEHHPAPRATFQAALDKQGAFALDEQARREVLAHRRLDAGDARRGVRRLEVHLGEDHSQGRRRSAHLLLHPASMAGPGGVPVASDDGPLREADTRPRKTEARQPETVVCVHAGPGEGRNRRS
jgi:hypothetical protein